MAIAALTYVFNESVNLPIWLKYYGNLFGTENLFIVDHQSTDGSTKNLGDANVIRIPRLKFDDTDKAHFISSLQSALLRSHDAVVCGDCDELLVADPAKYADLNDYIARGLSDYATAVGVNVVQMIDRELPLDLGRPILAQRRYGLFSASICKTLLSRAPLVWSAGMHATNLPPKFDTDLFLFHTKLMDYGLAVTRQRLNQEIPWSEKSLQKNYGVQHRFDQKRLVEETFFYAIRALDANNVFDFKFDDVVANMLSSMTVSREGFHESPFGLASTVIIPDRFQYSI